MTVPFNASTRWRTSAATSIAFAPFRFDTASVTAGWKELPAANSTYCEGSSPPSRTTATSRRYTGRLFAPPATTFADVGGRAQKLAGFDNELLVRAGEAPPGSGDWMPPAPGRPGRERASTQRGALRRVPPASSRRSPPMMATAETLSACLMVSCTCAAILRSSKPAVTGTGQCQREDRDIIDGTRLDQRLRRAGRNQVEVGEHLLVQLDDALLLVLATLKRTIAIAAPGCVGRVDVLDSGNLPQELLHRLRDPLFDLPR